MQRALQAILIAGKTGQHLVRTGQKKSTIREGHRDYSIGQALIGCHLFNWAVLSDIVEVRHTLLQDLAPEDLAADGYADMEAAIVGLMRYYPGIGPTSPVTVVRWI